MCCALDQGLDINTYEAKKNAMADALIQRLDAQWPGLAQSISFREVRGGRRGRRGVGAAGAAVSNTPCSVPGGQQAGGRSSPRSWA